MMKPYLARASALAQFVFVALLAVVLNACAPAPAAAQVLSDYLENAIVDSLFRGQALPNPANLFIGLSTTACSDSSTGTEVTGGSYARVSIARSLTAWAGTQGAGTTVASSGTGRQTSNNSAINFPTPTANWGTVTHFFISDASTGGNLWLCQALTSSQTINTGNTVSFAAGQLTVTLQ